MFPTTGVKSGQIFLQVASLLSWGRDKKKKYRNSFRLFRLEV